MSHTILLGSKSSFLKKEDIPSPFMLVLALSFFGVLNAVLGYDAPQAPKVVKTLPKTVSHLPKQPEKQKSQQSLWFQTCDQKKRVLTQKVVVSPQGRTKGYTARLA